MVGRRMEWTAKTTEYEPTKKWGKDITVGATVLEEHLVFEPVEGGTKFTIKDDVKVGGTMKAFSRMIVGSQRMKTKESLKNIKRLLKAGN